MIKNNWVYFLFGFSVLFFIYKKFINKEIPQIHLTHKTFPAGQGWGYSIFTDDSLFIRQDYIPAIQGLKRFKTKEQAEKAALLVIKKVVKKQIPTINVPELDSMHITY